MTKYLIGALGGGIFGYTVLYKLIGCSTNACSITANPFIATIYGIVIGILTASMFSTKKISDVKDKR